jgi:hypothetical protein
VLLPPTPEPDNNHDTNFTTEANDFGLYQEYARKPQTDPEEGLTLVDLVDNAMPEQQDSEAAANDSLHHSLVDFFHPFSNATIFRYINWYLETSGKLSVVDLERLTCEVISSDDFNPVDLQNFSTA